MDLDAFVERAAIKEFEAGLSRFQAETQAAAEQGYARWQVMHALRDRDPQSTCHPGEAPVWNGENDLPTLQRQPEEKADPCLSVTFLPGTGFVCEGEIAFRRLSSPRYFVRPFSMISTSLPQRN